MKNALQLANRFKEVLLNGKWIANTNCQEQLSDISVKQATYKIKNLNTIYALTFHINYYVAGLLNVFEGGELEIKDKFSFDCPKISSEEKWNTIKVELISNAEKFAEHVEKMSDEQLATEFVKAEYGTYQRNIEAIIEHSYYHLGQISLIKKLVTNKTKLE